MDYDACHVSSTQSLVSILVQLVTKCIYLYYNITYNNSNIVVCEVSKTSIDTYLTPTPAIIMTSLINRFITL